MHTIIAIPPRLIMFYIYFLSLSCLIHGSTSTNSDSQSVFSHDEDNFEDSDEYHHFRSRRSTGEAKLFGESIIPDNYSIHEPPPTEDGKPSQLSLALLIMHVRGVKEIDEEITMELNMQVYWQDSRLNDFASKIKSKYVVLKPTFLEKLWHPDIFIDHLKSTNTPILLSKPASLRIYPDNTVRYSARMTIVLACQMDFHFYPADTQKCLVDIKSYAYTDNELMLSWRDNRQGGASFAHTFNLPNFYVEMDSPESFSLRTTSGAYSGLRFTILLTRKLSYHLMQTYLPSCLLVMVSWLSFLVPPDSVPGRMAICMTCLLTLIAMFASVRQSTPNVSYVKAIDIWMVVCVFFVFMALAEFCVVLKFLSIRRKEKKDEQGASQLNARGSRGSIPNVYYANTGGGPQHRRLQSPRGSLIIEENEMVEFPPPPSEARPPPLPLPYSRPPPFQVFTTPPEPPKSTIVHAKRVTGIELYTSIILPTLFFGFNFVYWPWLMASSQYYTPIGSTVIYSSGS